MARPIVLLEFAIVVIMSRHSESQSRDNGDRRRKRAKQRLAALATKPGAWFVLEINRVSVLAFSADTLASASVRLAEPWFMDELSRLQSAGRPLVRPDDVCAVRPATAAEAARVEMNRALDEASGEDAEYGFAFLIPLDSPPH